MILIVRLVSTGKECPYMLVSLLLDVPFRSSVIATLGNTRCPLLVFPDLVMFSFLLRSSLEQTSPFVSLIPRGHSEGCCHNPQLYRDRPKCNSHFRGSSSLPPRPISSLNVLTGINYLLNCYLVEKLIGSPHYPPLQFGFLDRNRYPCFVWFLDIL